MPKHSILTLAVMTTLLSGCNAALTLKVPASTAKAADAVAPSNPGSVAPGSTTSGNTPLVTPNKPVSGTPATVVPATTLKLPTSLQLPSDVSVRLPAALIGEHAAGVISNDGGSVISNDGGSVISNDGGSVISNDGGSVISNDGGSAIVKGNSYRLASTADAVVADYCHFMIDSYSYAVGIINLLLNTANDPDNLADMLASKPVTGPVILPDAIGKYSFNLGLMAVAGQNPTLTADVYETAVGPSDSKRMLELTFIDKDNGRAVFRLPSANGDPQKGDYLTCTFDHVHNKGTIDAFFGDAGGLGVTRMHIDVARPAVLVKDGPTLEVKLTSTSRQTSDVNLADGIIKVTALGLPDGSLSAVFGTKPFLPNGTAGDFAFAVNPTQSDSTLGSVFFLDNKGVSIAKPSADLLLRLPDPTDLAPDMVDPASSSFNASTDSTFAF